MLGTTAIIVITAIIVEVLKMGLLLWCLRAVEMTRNRRVPSYKDIIQAIIVPKVSVVPATGLIGFST
jgi:hypothetical protein